MTRSSPTVCALFCREKTDGLPIGLHASKSIAIKKCSGSLPSDAANIKYPKTSLLLAKIFILLSPIARSPFPTQSTKNHNYLKPLRVFSKRKDFNHPPNTQSARQASASKPFENGLYDNCFGKMLAQFPGNVRGWCSE